MSLVCLHYCKKNNKVFFITSLYPNKTTQKLTLGGKKNLYNLIFYRSHSEVQRVNDMRYEISSIHLIGIHILM